MKNKNGISSPKTSNLHRSIYYLDRKQAAHVRKRRRTKLIVKYKEIRMKIQSKRKIGSEMLLKKYWHRRSQISENLTEREREWERVIECKGERKCMYAGEKESKDTYRLS
jgi:hypothetical protein